MKTLSIVILVIAVCGCHMTKEQKNTVFVVNEYSGCDSLKMELKMNDNTVYNGFVKQSRKSNDRIVLGHFPKGEYKVELILSNWKRFKTVNVTDPNNLYFRIADSISYGKLLNSERFDTTNTIPVIQILNPSLNQNRKTR
jgi:hypothetical protein